MKCISSATLYKLKHLDLKIYIMLMLETHFVSIVVCRIHILDHLVQLFFFSFFFPMTSLPELARI